MSLLISLSDTLPLCTSASVALSFWNSFSSTSALWPDYTVTVTIHQVFATHNKNVIYYQLAQRHTYTSSLSSCQCHHATNAFSNCLFRHYDQLTNVSSTLQMPTQHKSQHISCSNRQNQSTFVFFHIIRLSVGFPNRLVINILTFHHRILQMFPVHGDHQDHWAAHLLAHPQTPHAPGQGTPVSSSMVSYNTYILTI